MSTKLLSVLFDHESPWLSLKWYSSLFNKINNGIVWIKLLRCFFYKVSLWLSWKWYSSLFNKINNAIVWIKLIGFFLITSLLDSYENHIPYDLIKSRIYFYKPNYLVSFWSWVPLPLMNIIFFIIPIFLH